MTPTYHDPWLTVYEGDCRTVLASMPPESVHCVVTSPPYWGLRDYSVPGQLGLEPTPEQYVENMVAVFREVRRVLRSDGTVWLNLGDSYATGSGGSDKPRDRDLPNAPAGWAKRNAPTIQRTAVGSIKPKDLVGIPWRVAFALQADGWYLRSDIIWSKPNPMPESVTDRPTKSHEYLFLLTKSPRYYYDADAVREGVSDSTIDRWSGLPNRVGPNHLGTVERAATISGEQSLGVNPAGRNLRSVWQIATQPYPGAHFATFPEKLVEPCVKAGTSERGVCPECGAPWRRVVERTNPRLLDPDYVDRPATPKMATADSTVRRNDYGTTVTGLAKPGWRKLPSATSETTGWQPSCRHDAQPVPATVLDLFAGSGTTGRVAQRLGRRAVLIDLSAEYLKQAMERNRDIPLWWGSGYFEWETTV